MRILESFKDDIARLQALKTLADHEGHKAAQLLEKIKDNVNVGVLSKESQKHQRWMSVIAAVFFFAVGVIGFVASTQPTPPPPTKQVPASSPGEPLGTSKQQTTAEAPARLEPFSVRQYVNVGCASTSPGNVEYALPENAYEVQRSCSWEDRSNIKSASCATELAGSTVRASGSIVGLDKQLFNCPGGGHATLVLMGSYKVK